MGGKAVGGVGEVLIHLFGSVLVERVAWHFTGVVGSEKG